MLAQAIIFIVKRSPVNFTVLPFAVGGFDFFAPSVVDCMSSISICISLTLMTGREELEVIPVVLIRQSLKFQLSVGP